MVQQNTRISVLPLFLEVVDEPTVQQPKAPGNEEDTSGAARFLNALERFSLVTERSFSSIPYIHADGFGIVPMVLDRQLRRGCCSSALTQKPAYRSWFRRSASQISSGPGGYFLLG